MPRSRRAFAVGAVSKTYTSYSCFSIISTMFSNIADSSNAGFIVADSTKSSALVVMSANLQVAKEMIAWQIQQAMKKKGLTKKRMAELMETSRTQIDRLLSPKDHKDHNVT